MNQEQEDFDKLLEKTDETTNKDRVISDLEERIQSLEEQLLEERFYWVFLIVIFFDTVFFLHMENWGGPIAILILEVIGLIAFAKKCRVDMIVEIIDKILAYWPGQRNNGAQ